jgi:hypothetical protein
MTIVLIEILKFDESKPLADLIGFLGLVLARAEKGMGK